MRTLESGYPAFNQAARPALSREMAEANPSRRAGPADIGAVATERELFTFEKLDSMFDTGKVSFVEGRTYFDGQLVDGISVKFM